LLTYALAFSAGTFVCISLSDLLPELQFHDHDRVKLSAALLAGLALAVAVGKLETLVHRHPAAPTAAAVSGPTQSSQ
jgi:zinc and cadmium transporter